MQTTTVDSTLSAAATQASAQYQTSGSRALGKEEFMKLLIAQMQNQDPLSPLSNTEFVAQLATFSNLEQLITANDNLQAIEAEQANLVNSQALNLLGKQALVAGDGQVRVAGGRPDTIVYTLAGAAKDATLTIYGKNGETLRTLTLDPSGTGRVTLEWDGKDEHGNPLPDGDYRIEAKATDSSGNAIQVNVFKSLSIDGVTFESGGISLISGDREIPFDQIVEIRAGQSE